ncbi:MAG: hypothetical protein LBK94_05370 [Prevotellaceae bacterium]|jgi:chromosomal replication initiation ATPase DnaA|nr:hypothetical protein [Prevotellaceae bacterium]
MTEQQIIETVCNVYCVDFVTVNNTCRKIHIVEVRHAVAYFVKEYKKTALVSIGKLFTPIRHHSTVINSIKTYKNLIYSDAYTRNQAIKIRKILNKLNNNFNNIKI